jgi:hypothetical protein
VSFLRHDLPTLDTLGQQVWQGKIATAPTDFAQRVQVIIPDFDAELRWGPCRWQARDEVSFPVVGDSCLVIFDNDREPWVVAWWPFLT